MTKATHENPNLPSARPTGSEMLDALSKSVTTLCQAIDPESTHGPETENIAEYAKTGRRLAIELARGVFVGNVHFQRNKAREVLDHYGVIEQTNGGIVGFPNHCLNGKHSA